MTVKTARVAVENGRGRWVQYAVMGKDSKPPQDDPASEKDLKKSWRMDMEALMSLLAERANQPLDARRKKIASRPGAIRYRQNPQFRYKSLHPPQSESKEQDPS